MLPDFKFLLQERAWVQGYLLSSLLQYQSSSVGTYPKITLEIHISSCMFNQVSHRVKIVMIKCPVYGSPLIETKKQKLTMVHHKYKQKDVKLTYNIHTTPAFLYNFMYMQAWNAPK